MGRCDPGLKKTTTLVVADEHTALALGSGDVPVVGTAALLALAEGACVEAIAGELSDDQTSVGAWAEIEHLAAAGVGATVQATATLIGHHNRRLEFAITMNHGDEVIARMRHRRVLVDRQRFLAKVSDQAA